MTGIEPLLVRTDDGVSLALYRAPHDGAASRATPLLLVHGTFSDRHFFLGTRERGLARELARHGFAAYVAELRGHGRSRADDPSRAWRFEDWIRRDAPALVRGVLEATGGERLAWIGHSAGGVVGLAFAGLGHELSGALAGLVLAGSPAPTGLGVHQTPMAATVLAVTRLLGRFPARRLGIGPEDEPAGILAQWMRWNLARRWRGEDGTDYLANCARVTVPILALAGAGDWMWAPPRKCRDLVDAVSSPDRTFVTCGRSEGFALDLNHNQVLVSVTAREQVWPLIADWLERRFS